MSWMRFGEVVESFIEYGVFNFHGAVSIQFLYTYNEVSKGVLLPALQEEYIIINLMPGKNNLCISFKISDEVSEKRSRSRLQLELEANSKISLRIVFDDLWYNFSRDFG